MGKKIITKKKTVGKAIEKAAKKKIIDPLIEAEDKRNKLILSIKNAGLLTKGQLKRGGSYVRTSHQKEQGFNPIIAEINTLGAELGLRPIGLGNLRGE